MFLNKLDYQFALGMIDLKDAKLDSAQIRLAVMQSYLSEFKHFDAKNQAAFHCQVLKAELLYQRENFQAAIEAAHEVTRIRQHGFG